MVILDRRRGSGELEQALSKKVPVVVDTLPAGDFAFEGWYEGPDGADVSGMIGVERKRITNDFITCMMDGRFSGFQLIEMVDYFKVLYLIVEGVFRPNKDTGVLEFWGFQGRNPGWITAQRGRNVLMYSTVMSYLNTMKMKTPVHDWRSSTPDETVEMVRCLYNYHQKPMSQHQSHMSKYQKPIGGPLSFIRPSRRRVIASDLPGVGWKKALAVEKHFRNTKQMINAPVEEWMEIDGIGRGIATKIVTTLEEE